jgi:hypothetical protein
MTLYTWSKTASSNAIADSTINWAEGQAPSSVNDSARATMAAVAKYRDDNSGSITTAGTSTAYTAASNQVFDTLAHLDQQQITIVPHTTSGASATLNVDGLGAKPIRSSTGVSAASGALVQGTPYRLTYYNTAGEFVLEGGVAAIPGNFSIGGTLTVTGAQTFTGTATFSSTISVAGKASFTSTDSMAVANGTTAQRNGSPSAGDFRYNSTLSCFEGYNGTTWVALGKAPTVQKFTSGSSLTYTPSTGVVRIRVRMVGGGGGGGAANTNNGSGGGDTSFGSWTAIHGSGGVQQGTGGAGGTGGVNGTGTLITRIDGQNGGSGLSAAAAGVNPVPGLGGSTPFGGGGVATGTGNSNGGSAKANTGSGGSGAIPGANSTSAGGGGAGEYVEFWVNSPGATTYTIGVGGNGGSAGGQAGGNGAAGVIVIEEFYS